MEPAPAPAAGGLGAASHAIDVYGGMDAQHASGSGNMIAQNPVLRGGQYKFRMTRRGTARGSRRGTRRSKRMGGKQSKSSRGGTTLTEFAVPAALLFATRFGSRRPSKNVSSQRFRRSRRSRRFRK